MEENGFNETTVIKKNEPAFPDHLDFAFLREQTLTHLGQLSGKVWTDHNVHDPGITILEVLIYALLDLGYRVQLPMKDLLAKSDAHQGSEDNFFTPNQVFTNNPTTIIDYRKMLMDIKGVRNAWLEIVQELREGEGTALYLKSDGNGTFSLNNVGEGRKINLNGLYRVHLQLDKEEPYSRVEGNNNVIEKAVLKEARKRLGSHRNLGEDFASINVYCEEEIGIEVDLEIEETTNLEALYIQILLELDQFFSPNIPYYTLQQLLDKGKSIEEIYEGRPFTLESHGFIDTDELEKGKLPGTIYLSDIYRLLLNLKGVKNARNLRLISFVNGVEKTVKANSSNCPDLIHCVQECCAPVFCVDRSKIQLRVRNDVFRINKSREKALLREKLSGRKKTLYKGGDQLDQQVENGNYRADLSDYYSIQNDFPAVYLIGEGQMPSDVPDLRKAQGLQLKGYLLFFDQLLAGYLKQLSHLRDLFSLRPDSQRTEEVRHTHFATDLQSVPGIEKLLRFFDGSSQYSEGSLLAIPVDRHTFVNGILPAMAQDSNHAVRPKATKFETAYQRDAVKEQFQREFIQSQYTTEIFKDKYGYFFVLQTAFNDIVLLGNRRYPTEKEASVEADSVAYFGTLIKNYREINHFVSTETTSNGSETTYFSFELIFHDIDYLTLLQDLVENQSTYQQRRNDFLDHLLSRFAFSFTDYSLLLYQSATEQGPTDEALIEYKGNLLSNIDHLSRNRGRAFDYCRFSWNSNNVSGLENQLAALSGVLDYKRQNLCNFEVAEYLQEPSSAGVDDSSTTPEQIFSYHILQRDQPLAFYPCKCFSNDEAGLVNLREKRNALFGPAEYFMICLGGDVICQIEDSYHFQLKGKGDGKVYFVSFMGYPTEEEAKAAFEENYLWVIHLASNSANYCNPTNADSCTDKISTIENYESIVESCADGGAPLVVIPAAMTSPAFDQDDFVKKFSSFPIRLVEVNSEDPKCLEPLFKYYFRILGGIDCDEKWRSYDWYRDVAEVWKDFRLFVSLLDNPVNYRSVFDMNGYLKCWANNKMPKQEDLLNGCCVGPCNEDSATGLQKCCHYLALVEVLATSTFQYGSESQAWGTEQYELTNGDYIYLTDEEGQPVQFSTFEEACQKINELGFVVEADAESPTYRYVVEGEGCCFYIIESRRLQWENIVTGQNGLNLSNCQEHLSCAERFNQKTGLEEFLKYGSDRSNYFTTFSIISNATTPMLTSTSPSEGMPSTPEDICFGFVVVNDHYRIARHPYAYSTEEELTQIKSQLDGCSWMDETKVVIETEAVDTSFRIVYKKTGQGNNEYLWKSEQTFTSEASATEAGKRAIFDLMEYAREQRFYLWVEYANDEKGRLYLCKRGDFPMGMSVSNKLKLCRNEDSLLGYWDFSSLPTEDELAVKIAEQIMDAKGYPFVRRNEEIGFQLYCPNFRTGTVDDAKSCQACLASNANNSDPAAEPAEVVGGVIWESYHTYSSLEEAQCHFYNFEQIFKDNPQSYVQIGDAKCKSYSLLFVNKEGIIAEHPQCHQLKSEVEAAIEKTIACVNMEGFHLVEHLLLRPGFAKDQPEGENTTDNDCLLAVHPDADCCLPIDVEEEGTSEKCWSAPETAGEPKRNGFAGRLQAEDACIKCDFSVNISKKLKTEIIDFMVVPENLTGTHLLVNDQGVVLQTLGYKNGESPEFVVTQEGKYRIHGLVHDGNIPTITINETTVSEILEALTQGGGTAAGDLDTLGVSFEVGLCKDIYVPGADPYSFWTTLVLPDWTERYREAGFRDGFQHLVHRVAPAHVGMNIRWIQPREMYEFENLYKLWLHSLLSFCRKGTTEVDAGCPGGNIPCDFVEMLSNLAACSRITEDQVLDPNSARLMTMNGLSNQAVARLFNPPNKRTILPGRAISNLNENSNAQRWLNRSDDSTPSAVPTTSSEDSSDLGDQGETTIEVGSDLLTTSPDASTLKEPNDSGSKTGGKTQKKTPQRKPSKKTSTPSSKTTRSKEPKNTDKTKEPPLNKKELRRRMRKRMSHYTTVVKAKADINLSKSKMYERTLDFLGSTGSTDLFAELMQFVIRHGLKRKNADVERYQMLVENAVWFYLDNQIMNNASTVQDEEALKAIVAELKSHGIDFKVIGVGWNESELERWMDVPVVAKYAKMIK